MNNLLQRSLPKITAKKQILSYGVCANRPIIEINDALQKFYNTCIHVLILTLESHIQTESVSKHNGHNAHNA